MKKLFIILLLFIPFFAYADNSEVCNNNSDEFCDTYINEYNVEVCSCNKKVLDIPMIIFGDIRWKNIGKWAELFIYDKKGNLLTKSIILENWKYWTNKAFEIDKKINLNKFEDEIVFKIKYWRNIFSNIKIEKDWEYNCNDKLIFQTNKLCKYNLDLTNAQIYHIWWWWHSWWIKKIKKDSRVKVKKIVVSKYKNKVGIVKSKIDKLIDKFNKRWDLDIQNLEKEVLKIFENYLKSIDKWDKEKSKILFKKLKIKIKELYKELSLTKKEKILIKVNKKLNILIDSYGKKNNEEIINLKNKLIQKIEKYIENPKNKKLRKELILEIKKFYKILQI